jgi:hypothetical protein
MFGTMNVTTEAAHAGRRKHPRLRVGIPARLETVHGTKTVDLLNLSQAGAKIDLAQIPKVREAILRWLDFEAMGNVIWQDGEQLGIVFDSPLTAEAILATRKLAPSVVEEEVSEAARIWSIGDDAPATQARIRMRPI